MVRQGISENTVHHDTGNQIRINGSIPAADYLDDQGLCDCICTDGRPVKSDRNYDDLYTTDSI